MCTEEFVVRGKRRRKLNMAPDTFWNGTITHGSHLGTLLFVFNCIVLSLTFLLGLVVNLLVCWVVYKTKRLRTVNNALLISLAASDLLKCSVDTPLLLFCFLIYGKDNEASASLCSLQQFSYALCSCVQLLTLTSISVERFQAIAFPFQVERRKTRVRLWILSIWLGGLTLAVVSLTISTRTLTYVHCHSHLWVYSEDHHQRSPDPFLVYILVPLWGCSLTLIVIHYLRIFNVVRQHRNKVFDSGIQLGPTVARHVWSRLGVATTPPQAALLHSYHQHPSLLPLGRPQRPRRTVVTVAQASSCANNSSENAHIRPPEIVGDVCLLTPHAKERAKKRVEEKLAQRFGYIIIVFTLFWVPMVVTLLMNIVSWPKTNPFLVELETSAIVLTCVPAAVDPLIYTMVTRQFRSELGKIIACFPGCPLQQKG